MNSSRSNIVLGLILVLYVVLAAARAITDGPTEDEGWFACPAANLITTGRMNNSVLDMTGTWGAGLKSRAYWTMPLSYVVQAGWYQLFGFSLAAMRSLSMLFGLLALVAYYVLMKKATDNVTVALLACGLIAVDFAFIRSASSGRMDMMSAALAVSAYAGYFRFRERNFTLAVLLGHTLCAANCITHPNALIGLLFLWFFMIYFDRSRLDLRLVLLALLPYFVAAGAWGIYILQDPQNFVTQFFGNAGQRLWGLSSPLAAIIEEIRERYTGTGSPITVLVRSLLLFLYWTGVVYAIANTEIRRSRAFAVLAPPILGTAFYLTFFEGTKLYNYGVHITPLLACAGALSVQHAASRRPGRRWLYAAVLLFAVVQAAGTALVVRRDSYHTLYMPVVEYLRDHWDQETLLWGPAELGFQFGYIDALVDDGRLGFYSGRRAEWIVFNRRNRNDCRAWAKNNPPLREHIARLLKSSYQPVYVRDATVIYRRRPVGAAVQSSDPAISAYEGGEDPCEAPAQPMSE